MPLRSPKFNENPKGDGCSYEHCPSRVREKQHNDVSHCLVCVLQTRVCNSKLAVEVLLFVFFFLAAQQHARSSGAGPDY